MRVIPEEDVLFKGRGSVGVCVFRLWGWNVELVPFPFLGEEKLSIGVKVVKCFLVL